MKEERISKKRIRKVGDKLATNQLSDAERLKAFELVGSWRVEHIEPLRWMLHELERVCCLDSSVTLVGRLKRIDTIVNKLSRPNIREDYIKLDTMRDIAGCRLIVANEKDVLHYAELISGMDACHKVIDHMNNPKPSGYRGIHVVCRHGDRNLNVEVQIRSQLQHSWATAVEAYDQIKGTSLKFDQGSDCERRYFRLVSDVMNNNENNLDSAIEELRFLDKKLRVLEVLSAASDSMFVSSKGEIDRSSSCLLTVDLGIQQVGIEVFPSEKEGNAINEYTKLETENKESSVIYLLARAGSLKDLCFAYSNYSSDISQFVSWLTSTIGR